MPSVYGDGDYNGGTPPATTPRDRVLNLGLGVTSQGSNRFVDESGPAGGATLPVSTGSGGRMPIQEGYFADTGAAQGRSEEQYFLEERQRVGRNGTEELGRRNPIAGDLRVVQGNPFTAYAARPMSSSPPGMRTPGRASLSSARTPTSPASTSAGVWHREHPVADANNVTSALHARSPRFHSANGLQAPVRLLAGEIMSGFGASEEARGNVEARVADLECRQSRSASEFSSPLPAARQSYGPPSSRAAAPERTARPANVGLPSGARLNFDDDIGDDSEHMALRDEHRRVAILEARRAVLERTQALQPTTEFAAQQREQRDRREAAKQAAYEHTMAGIKIEAEALDILESAKPFADDGAEIFKRNQAREQLLRQYLQDLNTRGLTLRQELEATSARELVLRQGLDEQLAARKTVEDELDEQLAARNAAEDELQQLYSTTPPPAVHLRQGAAFSTGARAQVQHQEMDHFASGPCLSAGVPPSPSSDPVDQIDDTLIAARAELVAVRESVRRRNAEDEHTRIKQELRQLRGLDEAAHVPDTGQVLLAAPRSTLGTTAHGSSVMADREVVPLRSLATRDAKSTGAAASEAAFGTLGRARGETAEEHTAAAAAAALDATESPLDMFNANNDEQLRLTREHNDLLRTSLAARLQRDGAASEKEREAASSKTSSNWMADSTTLQILRALANNFDGMPPLFGRADSLVEGSSTSHEPLPLSANYASHLAGLVRDPVRRASKCKFFGKVTPEIIFFTARGQFGYPFGLHPQMFDPMTIHECDDAAHLPSDSQLRTMKPKLAFTEATTIETYVARGKLMALWVKFSLSEDLAKAIVILLDRLQETFLTDMLGDWTLDDLKDLLNKCLLEVTRRSGCAVSLLTSAISVADVASLYLSLARARELALMPMTDGSTRIPDVALPLDPDGDFFLAQTELVQARRQRRKAKLSTDADAKDRRLEAAASARARGGDGVEPSLVQSAPNPHLKQPRPPRRAAGWRPAELKALEAAQYTTAGVAMGPVFRAAGSAVNAGRRLLLAKEQDALKDTKYKLIEGGYELCVRNMSNDGCPFAREDCHFNHLLESSYPSGQPPGLENGVSHLPRVMQQFFVSLGGVKSKPTIPVGERVARIAALRDSPRGRGWSEDTLARATASGPVARIALPPLNASAAAHERPSALPPVYDLLASSVHPREAQARQLYFGEDPGMFSVSPPPPVRAFVNPEAPLLVAEDNARLNLVGDYIRSVASPADAADGSLFLAYTTRWMLLHMPQGDDTMHDVFQRCMAFSTRSHSRMLVATCASYLPAPTSDSVTLAGRSLLGKVVSQAISMRPRVNIPGEVPMVPFLILGSLFQARDLGSDLTFLGETRTDQCVLLTYGLLDKVYSGGPLTEALVASRGAKAALAFHAQAEQAKRMLGTLDSVVPLAEMEFRMDVEDILEWRDKDAHSATWLGRDLPPRLEFSALSWAWLRLVIVAARGPGTPVRIFVIIGDLWEESEARSWTAFQVLFVYHSMPMAPSAKRYRGEKGASLFLREAEKQGILPETLPLSKWRNLFVESWNRRGEVARSTRARSARLCSRRTTSPPRSGARRARAAAIAFGFA